MIRVVTEAYINGVHANPARLPTRTRRGRRLEDREQGVLHAPALSAGTGHSRLMAGARPVWAAPASLLVPEPSQPDVDPFERLGLHRMTADVRGQRHPRRRA